jgi:hypothetical protein
MENRKMAGTKSTPKKGGAKGKAANAKGTSTGMGLKGKGATGRARGATGS